MDGDPQSSVVPIPLPTAQTSPSERPSVQSSPERPKGARDLPGIDALEIQNPNAPLYRSLHQAVVCVPNENRVNKMKQHINNLGESNMERIKTELLDVVLNNECYYDYLSKYLIYRRIINEDIHIKRYCDFIDTLNNPVIRRKIEHDAYEASKSLMLCRYDSAPPNPAMPQVPFRFNPQESVGSSNEKNQLKLLGQFIGMFVIAHNRAIPSTILDLKIVLINAFQFGKLHIVLPFVLSILSFCPQSQAFANLKQPWVQAQLRICAEIASFSLVSSLVFLIQHFCETFSVLQKGVTDENEAQDAANRLPRSDYRSRIPEELAFLRQFANQSVFKLYPIAYDIENGNDCEVNGLKQLIAMREISVVHRSRLVLFSELIPNVTFKVFNEKNLIQFDIAPERSLALLRRSGRHDYYATSVDLSTDNYPKQLPYTEQVLKATQQPTNNLRIVSEWESRQILPHLTVPFHKKPRTPAIEQIFSSVNIEGFHAVVEFYINNSCETCFPYICKKVFPIAASVIPALIFQDATFTVASDKNTLTRHTLSSLEASLYSTPLVQLENLLWEGLERLTALQAYTFVLPYLRTRSTNSIAQEFELQGKELKKTTNELIGNLIIQNKDKLTEHLLECVIDDYSYLLVDRVTKKVLTHLQPRVRSALSLREKIISNLGDDGWEARKQSWGNQIEELSRPILSDFYIYLPQTSLRKFEEIPQSLHPVGSSIVPTVSDISAPAEEPQFMLTNNDHNTSLRSSLHTKFSGLLPFYPHSSPRISLNLSNLPYSLLKIFESPILRDAANLLPSQIKTWKMKDEDMTQTSNVFDYFQCRLQNVHIFKLPTKSKFVSIIESFASELQERFVSFQSELDQARIDLLSCLASYATLTVDYNVMNEELLNLHVGTQAYQEKKRNSEHNAKVVRDNLLSLSKALAGQNEVDKRRACETISTHTISCRDMCGAYDPNSLKAIIRKTGDEIFVLSKQLEEKIQKLNNLNHKITKEGQTATISQSLQKKLLPLQTNPDTSILYLIPPALLTACTSLAQLFLHRFCHHNAAICTDILLTGPSPLVTIHYSPPAFSIQDMLHKIPATSAIHFRAEECHPEYVFSTSDNDQKHCRPNCAFVGKLTNREERELYERSGKAFSELSTIPSPSFTSEEIKSQVQVSPDPIFSNLSLLREQAQNYIDETLSKCADDEPPKSNQKLTVSTLLSPLFDSLYDTKRETTTSIDNIRIFLFAPCCLHAPSKEAFRKKTGTLRSMRPEELKEASDLQILMMGLLPSFEAYPQFIREIYISVFTGSLRTYQNICQAATRSAVVSTVLKDVMTRTTPSFILSPPLPRMIANVISPTSEFYGPQMDKADHTKPRSLMSTLTLSTHNTTKTMSMHYAQQARTLFGLLTEGQLDPHLYFDSMKLFLVLLWKSAVFVRPIETKERQERTVRVENLKEGRSELWKLLDTQLPPDSPQFLFFLHRFANELRQSRKGCEECPYQNYFASQKMLSVTIGMDEATNTLNLATGEAIIVPSLANHLHHHLTILTELLVMLMSISVHSTPTRTSRVPAEFSKSIQPFLEVLPRPNYKVRANPEIVMKMRKVPVQHDIAFTSVDQIPQRTISPSQTPTGLTQSQTLTTPPVSPHSILIAATELIDTISLLNTEWNILSRFITRGASFPNPNSSLNRNNIDIPNLYKLEASNLSFHKQLAPGPLLSSIRFWELSFIRQKDFEKPSDDEETLTISRTISLLGKAFGCANGATQSCHALLSSVRTNGSGVSSTLSAYNNAVRVGHDTIMSHNTQIASAPLRQRPQPPRILPPQQVIDSIGQLLKPYFEELQQSRERIGDSSFREPVAKKHFELLKTRLCQGKRGDEATRTTISQCFFFIRHAIQYKHIPQVVAECFRLLDFLLDASAEATVETHNSVHLKDQDLRWVVSSDGAPKTFILGRTDVIFQQELVRAINQLMPGLNDFNDMFPRVFHSQLIRLADPLYLKKKADGHEQASFHLVCNNPEWDVFFACLRLLFEPIIRIDLQIDGRERELKAPEVQNWRILQQDLYDKAFLVVKELVQNKQEFVDVYRPHLLVMFENDRKGNLLQLVSDSSCIDVGKAVETIDSWDSEICGFLRSMPMRKKREGTKEDVEAGQQMREHFEKDAQIRQFLSYSYYPNPTLRMYQQQSIAIKDITASFTFYMEQGQCELLNLNTIHAETQPQLTTLVEHLNRLTDISPPHEYWQGSFPYFMLFLIEEGGRQFLNHLKHERSEVVKQRQAILNGDIEAKTHILECKGALNVMSVIYYYLAKLIAHPNAQTIKVAIQFMLTTCTTPNARTAFVSNTFFFLLLGGNIGPFLKTETSITRTSSAQVPMREPKTVENLNQLLLSLIFQRYKTQLPPWGIRQVTKTINTRTGEFTGHEFSEFREKYSRLMQQRKG